MTAIAQDLSSLATYRETAPSLLARHGGRYMLGPSEAPWEVLEGTRPPITGVTILEFPSMEKARAWHNDPEYAPLIRLRQAGSTLDLLLVEGSDG
jgi:uncharacterized protein (DUF1330 family)